MMKSKWFAMNKWIVLTLSVAFLAATQLTHADAISTTGTGGNWTENGTWTGGVVPGQSDDVTILDGAGVTVNQNSYAKSLTIESGGTLMNGTNFTLRLYGDIAANNGKDSFKFDVMHQYLYLNFYSNSVWSGSADMSNLKTGINILEDGVLDISGVTEPMKFLQGFGGGIHLEAYGALIAGTQVIQGNLSAGGTAYFRLRSGATIECANPNGLIGDTATISDFATVDLNTGANYIFNGTESQITTGMPTTVNNLTINNASGVTLTDSVTVNGALEMNQSTLTVDTSDTLTLAPGTPASFSADGTALTVIGGCNGAGNITLNANTITVDVQNNPLIPGDYTLMQCDGTLSNTGTFGAPTITGVGLAAGSTASVIATTGIAGTLVLRITSSLPATTTTLTRTAGTTPSEYGDSLTFHAVVSPDPGNGETIIFTSNGSLIGTATTSAGTADLTTATLPYTGGSTAEIKAIFSGNTSYAGSAGTLSGGQEVSQRTLTLTGATAEDKMYDGTTDAVISGGTLNNVVSGDDVVANTGTFAQATTGTAINVTVNLSGDDAASYSLTQPALTADILDTATWASTTGGLWSTAANWQDSLIGDGEDNTIKFDTLDITTDTTVTLDSTRSANQLIFGDTTTNSAAGWIIDNNATPANTLTLGGDTPTISVDALGTEKDVTINAVVAGTAGLAKEGEGELKLTAENTYSGTTTINAGTVTLDGGDNRIPATGDIDFDGVEGSTVTVDIGTNNQTLANIEFPSTQFSSTMTAQVTGEGGSLTINGTASDLNLGPRIVGHVITDLSELSGFIYDSSGRNFRVGFVAGTTGATQNPCSTVNLAETNTITANYLNMGDQTLNGGGGYSTLRLGKDNTLNLNHIRTAHNGRSSALMEFLEEGSSVKIRSANGTSAVNTWYIGNVTTYNETTWYATVDFSKGFVDADVDAMIIGNANIWTATRRLGIEYGLFKLGDGIVKINNYLLIGSTSSNGGEVGNGLLSANGTFTICHSNGVLEATAIYLAKNTITATNGTREVSGTFSLEAGTVKAGTIQKDIQIGTATATAAFNWTDGTICNLDSEDMTFEGLPITLLPGTHTFNISGSNTATVDINSPISGEGEGIVKIGTGTLSLSATNTYSGCNNCQ